MSTVVVEEVCYGQVVLTKLLKTSLGQNSVSETQKRSSSVAIPTNLEGRFTAEYTPAIRRLKTNQYTLGRNSAGSKNKRKNLILRWVKCQIGTELCGFKTKRGQNVSLLMSSTRQTKVEVGTELCVQNTNKLGRNSVRNSMGGVPDVLAIVEAGPVFIIPPVGMELCGLIARGVRLNQVHIGPKLCNKRCVSTVSYWNEILQVYMALMYIERTLRDRNKSLRTKSSTLDGKFVCHGDRKVLSRRQREIAVCVHERLINEREIHCDVNLSIALTVTNDAEIVQSAKKRSERSSRESASSGMDSDRLGSTKMDLSTLARMSPLCKRHDRNALIELNTTIPDPGHWSTTRRGSDLKESAT
ncbi:hypothetical protein C8Q75DRAFT_816042 [Abortiporus biennis]|nr:hypothetical protein C8Q75DRAFT_816042 [Abortiporus biennis]